MEQNTDCSDEDFARALEEALASDSEHTARAAHRKGDQGGWNSGRTTQVTHGQSEKFELQNLSHVHEAIMNWMIAHPNRNLRECARDFGYTQSWLSILIHSDIFQARLREKQDQVFSCIKEDVTTKLGALADIGVERLTAQVEASSDPKLIMEATKMALSSLGFGNKAAAPAQQATNIQNNSYYVASPADLEAARERMRQTGAGTVSPSPAPDAPLLEDATLNNPVMGDLRNPEPVQTLEGRQGAK